MDLRTPRQKMLDEEVERIRSKERDGLYGAISEIYCDASDLNNLEGDALIRRLIDIRKTCLRVFPSLGARDEKGENRNG